MMKQSTKIISVLLLCSVTANVVLWMELSKPQEVKVESHTEYVMIKDTNPVMTESHKTDETLTVTAAVNHANIKPTNETEHDTVATVSIVGDSATVTLPVEQRVYKDSLYTAYVSGYRPKLDSINLRLPHTYTTITKTVSKPYRRFALGPTVGAGYGITGRQFDVFIGVSATWNIFQ